MLNLKINKYKVISFQFIYNYSLIGKRIYYCNIRNYYFCFGFNTFTTVSGENGRVEYNIIAGDEDSAFEVDIDNGTLRTRRPLDREAKPVYNLVVMATDQAKLAHHRLSSTVQVKCLHHIYLIISTKKGILKK